MTEQEQNLEWWEKETPEPEEIPTQEELMETVRKMKLAGDAIPRGFILRRLLTVAYLILNAFIAYFAIGKTYQTIAFAYLAPGILICIDYIIVVNRLKDIQGGKK